MGFFLLTGMPVGAQAPNTPADPPLPSYTVALTGYNAVPEQTDATPFETASGLYSNPEIVAARSQDFGKELPFGTIIAVDGSAASGEYCGYDAVKKHIGYRVIADTMNPRFTKRIDILFSTESNYPRKDGSVANASGVLGLCKNVTIRVVGFVDITKTRKIPATQKELAALVEGKDKLAVK